MHITPPPSPPSSSSASFFPLLLFSLPLPAFFYFIYSFGMGLHRLEWRSGVESVNQKGGKTISEEYGREERYDKTEQKGGRKERKEGRKERRKERWSFCWCVSFM